MSEREKTWTERYEENERKRAVRFLQPGTRFRCANRVGVVLEISASSVRVEWEPQRSSRTVYDAEGKPKEEIYTKVSGQTVNVAPGMEVDEILAKEDISMGAIASKKKEKSTKGGKPPKDWSDKMLPASFQRNYKDALYSLKRTNGGWSVNGKGNFTIREAMVHIQGGSAKGRTVSFFFKESQIIREKSGAQSAAQRPQSKPKAKKKVKGGRRKK